MAYKFLDSVGLSHVFAKIKLLLNDKADTDHTHKYAGSASVGGAANSAVKLETARTINGVSFDGTKNISIDTGVTSVNGSTGAVTLKDYVTGLSVNGKTITYNKKDGTSGTITTQDTTYSAATTSAAGLMSTTDKAKLNGIADGANNYSLPAATSSALGGVKIGSNISVSSGTISLSKANVTNALGYTPPTTNTTYGEATTSADGLMSAEDKAKLDGIASGANNYTLPTATASVLGGVKVGSNISVSSGTISLTKANVTNALGYTPPTTDTTYDAATTAEIDAVLT